MHYNCTSEEAAEREKFVSDTIDEIAALTVGKSVEDKAMIVYNYFLDTYTYDNSLTNYDIYRLFKEHKGTCCSFSLGYKAVMDRLNIPCELVVTKDNTHEWVRMDGKNIDITMKLYKVTDFLMKSWGFNF